MREWLVIECSWKNSVFATDDAKVPRGYIPRDVAEPLLGRDLGGTVWFTAHESRAMYEHPEWRHTEPPKTVIPECPGCKRWRMIKAAAMRRYRAKRKVKP